MKNQSIFRRFLFAWDGLKSSFRTEKSFRTHVYVAVAVIIFMAIECPRPLWLALMTVVLAMMMVVELINTAVEKLADRLHPEIHPAIKEVKDALAAAVLLICIAGGVVLLAYLHATKQLVIF